MSQLPAHSQHSYPTAESSICGRLPLTMTSMQTSVHQLRELCNLPELEVTPIARPTNNDKVPLISERRSSLSADTATDRNLKEKSDMENLLIRLPILNQFFQLHSKIGEGTFSSVYLASLRNSKSTKKYAVKHLTQNFHQLRIEGEFRCMSEIGGKDNVVHVDYCLASGRDCVTFVMPYLPHKKFSDYVLDMNAEETRIYMKNLFIALRRVHSFNVIHRDVKPGNFLYNRETKEFLLIDFGLAQFMHTHRCDGNRGHPAMDENMPIDYSKKRKRKESVSDKEATPVKRSKRMALKSKDNNVRINHISDVGNVHCFGSPVALPINNSDRIDLKSPPKLYSFKADAEKTPMKGKTFSCVGNSARRKNLFDDSSPDIPENDKSFISSVRSERKGNSLKGVVREKSFTPLISYRSNSTNFVQVRSSKVIRQCDMLKSKISEKSPRNAVVEQCSCTGKGTICSVCSSRSKMIAPRAGTPGFRPPEVLFKHLDQTTAVDMWASGVILLCILSGCYPFFNSPNDLVALAEIMTVFGTAPIIKIAEKFGRRVVCSNQRKGVNLKKLCKLLRARATKKSSGEKKGPNDRKCEDCSQTIRKDGCLCISENEEEELKEEGEVENGGFPDSAFHLLKRLLDLDPTTRITAAEALEHPFILGL